MILVEFNQLTLTCFRKKIETKFCSTEYQSSAALGHAQCVSCTSSLFNFSTSNFSCVLTRAIQGLASMIVHTIAATYSLYF
jgi:hypothetical protein